IFHQAGFNRQNGHNQVFNHAGNLVGAGLSGMLGWAFGLTKVLWLAAAFGALSIVSVLLIPSAAIDDDEARGLTRKKKQDKAEIGGFSVLLKNKTLLILAAALACFHLGNGAMLPLYGLAVVSTKQVDPSQFVGTTIVVAQGVMILDGVGAGLQSVVVPALVARILHGSGRINVGQGAVMTVQGVGASLSPLIG